MTHTFSISENNNTFRNLIGFSELFAELERWTETPTQNYPPYNVIQHSTSIMSLEIAVAGFSSDEISIELDKDVLSIEGKKEPAKEKKYLYRGLSNRPFLLSFKLASDVTITEASFIDGLLRLEIHKSPPETSKPLKIEIAIPE